MEGVYDFEHPHGVFDVHLRSNGRFFAPKFQCKAKWHATEAGEDPAVHLRPRRAPDQDLHVRVRMVQAPRGEH